MSIKIINLARVCSISPGHVSSVIDFPEVVLQFVMFDLANDSYIKVMAFQRIHMSLLRG